MGAAWAGEAEVVRALDRVDTAAILAFTLVGIIANQFMSRWLPADDVYGSPRWSWWWGMLMQGVIFPVLGFLAWREAGFDPRWLYREALDGGGVTWERCFLYALAAHMLKDLLGETVSQLKMDAAFIGHHALSCAAAVVALTMARGANLVVATTVAMEAGSFALNFLSLRPASPCRWEIFLTVMTASNAVGCAGALVLLSSNVALHARVFLGLTVFILWPIRQMLAVTRFNSERPECLLQQQGKVRLGHRTAVRQAAAWVCNEVPFDLGTTWTLAGAAFLCASLSPVAGLLDGTASGLAPPAPAAGNGTAGAAAGGPVNGGEATTLPRATAAALAGARTLLVEAEPVAAFRALVCGGIVLGLLRCHPAHSAFYRWFAAPDTAPLARGRNNPFGPTGRRGLGYSAHRVMGLFDPPALSPVAFDAVGALVLPLTFALAGAGATPPCALFAAFATYLLYFSQLFAESRAGGHGSCIIAPAALWYLACAPAGGGVHAWPLLFLKVHVASLYFSSAIGKIACSAHFRANWLSGAPLQHALYEGLWQRPGGGLQERLTELVLCRWWPPALMGAVGLALELAFPLALCGGRLELGLYAAAVMFHVGVLLVQNINFFTYWVPVLAVCLVSHDVTLPVAGVAAAGFAEAPVRFCLAAAYLALQLLSVATQSDLLLGEWLPLSCVPLFCLPRSLRDAWPKFFSFTTADCREGGFLEPCIAPYMNPHSAVWRIDEAELSRMKEPFAMFYTIPAPVPADIAKLVMPGVTGVPFHVVSNIDLPPAAVAKMRELVGLMEPDRRGGAFPGPVRDPAVLDRLLRLRREVMADFRHAAAAAGPARSVLPSIDTSVFVSAASG